jgi:hypothetical protein
MLVYQRVIHHILGGCWWYNPGVEDCSFVARPQVQMSFPEKLDVEFKTATSSPVTNHLSLERQLYLGTT